jgi:hypothetical protein
MRLPPLDSQGRDRVNFSPHENDCTRIPRSLLRVKRA